MKCDLCKNKEATVHVKQVCEGAVKELSVCADCAAEKGLDAQSPLSLTNFLFGMGSQAQAQAETAGEAQNRKCPGCGLRSSEFKKGSRLGCSVCYETFEEDLGPILAGMHPGTRHVGKVPASQRSRRSWHNFRWLCRRLSPPRISRKRRGFATGSAR